MTDFERENPTSPDASELEGGGTEQTWGQGEGAHEPTIPDDAAEGETVGPRAGRSRPQAAGRPDYRMSCSRASIGRSGLNGLSSAVAAPVMRSTTRREPPVAPMMPWPE